MDTDHITTIILESTFWVAKKWMSKFENLNTNDNPEDILGKREIWKVCLNIHYSWVLCFFYEVDPAKGKLLGDF